VEPEEAEEDGDEGEDSSAGVHGARPNPAPRIRLRHGEVFIARAGHDAATKPHHVDTLKHIALLGGVQEYVALSSKDLGRALGVSQQSASQRILELLEAGLLQRDLAVRRQRVRVSPKGLEVLRKEYADYHRIFDVRGGLTVRGSVTSGLGEGAFYMKQRGYKEQFKRTLGWEPYEGTLNLRVEGGDLAKLQILWDEPGTTIEGFQDGGRTFGGAKVFPAKVQAVECAVIVPIRTHHTDTVEVISRVYLRSKLGLKDGDVVAVDVRLAYGQNIQ
jgi:riboflavin kinase